MGAVCGSTFFDPWRARACEGLRGDVVEIGFGSGANLAHLPEEVHTVHAVEPTNAAWRLAAANVARSTTDVVVIEARAETLPLPDQSMDGALCTFTLCTVARADDVLAEVLRVLKPGAPLHFLEHGVSPDARIARWQRRLNGYERLLAGGCNLDRDPLQLVRDASFELEWSQQQYARIHSPWSYFTLGVARRPRR